MIMKFKIIEQLDQSNEFRKLHPLKCILKCRKNDASQYSQTISSLISQYCWYNIDILPSLIYNLPETLVAKITSHYKLFLNAWSLFCTLPILGPIFKFSFNEFDISIVTMLSSSAFSNTSLHILNSREGTYSGSLECRWRLHPHQQDRDAECQMLFFIWCLCSKVMSQAIQQPIKTRQV